MFTAIRFRTLERKAAETSLLSNLLMLIAVDTICSLWDGLFDDCVILPAKHTAYPLLSLLQQLLQQLLLFLREGWSMLLCGFCLRTPCVSRMLFVQRPCAMSWDLDLGVSACITSADETVYATCWFYRSRLVYLCPSTVPAVHSRLMCFCLQVNVCRHTTTIRLLTILGASVQPS